MDGYLFSTVLGVGGNKSHNIRNCSADVRIPVPGLIVQRVKSNDLGENK